MELIVEPLLLAVVISIIGISVVSGFTDNFLLGPTIVIVFVLIVCTRLILEKLDNINKKEISPEEDTSKTNDSESFSN